jgi:hypothetical protein
VDTCSVMKEQLRSSQFRQSGVSRPATPPLTVGSTETIW